MRLVASGEQAIKRSEVALVVLWSLTLTRRASDSTERRLTELRSLQGRCLAAVFRLLRFRPSQQSARRSGATPKPPQQLRSCPRAGSGQAGRELDRLPRRPRSCLRSSPTRASSCRSIPCRRRQWSSHRKLRARRSLDPMQRSDSSTTNRRVRLEQRSISGVVLRMRNGMELCRTGCSGSRIG